MVPAFIYFLGLPIRFYSLTLALGILAGYLVARQRIIQQGQSKENFDATILLSLILGFLGARLFFVIGHWPAFSQNFSDVLKIWQGGLAFYGALLGGGLGLLIFYYWHKFPVWKTLDALALGLPLAQAIGRFGNFFNQEAYGAPTRLPWRIYIDPAHRLVGFEDFSFYHPTFLYESLGLLLIFLFLCRLANKSHLAPGLIFATYAFLSGGLRFLVEFIRLDALVVQGLKISQLAAIVLMLVGIVLLVNKYVRRQQAQ